MNDCLASTLADIDCCAANLEQVKNAVFVFLEIAHQDIEGLRKVDNALLQSCNKRLTESLSIIELSGIVLETTVDLLTDSVNRLYQSQRAQPNSTTADN